GEDRVVDQVQRIALAVHFDRHLVDEERHVVVHHLDHGVRARPAVLLGPRVVDADLRHAAREHAREAQMGHRRAVEILGIAAREVLEVDVVVVVRDEVARFLRLRFGEPLRGEPENRLEEGLLLLVGGEMHWKCLFALFYPPRVSTLRRESRMLRHLKAAVLAAACIAVAAPAVAQETLKKIKETGTITIGHRDASIPFSYYDDQQKPVGYAMDICARIVEDVKKAVGNPNLKVAYQLVTSANRIPLMANGTIDLECGSTTNNLDRQKQVAFTNTHFITANRWVAKKSANLNSLADLKGKTIVSTAG